MAGKSKGMAGIKSEGVESAGGIVHILKRQVQLSLRITFENIVVPVLDRDREIGVSEGVAFEFVAAGATVGDFRFIRSLVSVEA